MKIFIYLKSLSRIALALVLCVFIQYSTRAQSTVGINVSAPALSPIPFAIPGTGSVAISLNGDWKFQEHGRTSTIKVPGEWAMQGFDVNAGETAVYSRVFTLPSTWENKRVKIKFDGVSSHAIVKVNGQKILEHEGSFVPFEADITNLLKSGNNLLQVEVQALTCSDILACTSQYAVHTVGGILRKVTLFALPDINITDFTIVTTFDKNYNNAHLQLKATVTNMSRLPAGISLRYVLTDKKGIAVVNKTILIDKGLTPGNSSYSDEKIPVISPKQWNTEQPYLYQLTTELLVNGKVVEQTKQNVGFRQVEIHDEQVFVNGVPIKVRGICRHSTHPITGRSVDVALDAKDAEIFKQANCNYIRTSHYPPTEEFLAAADRLGLFVEDESSLTWIGHKAAPIWTLWDYKDERFLPYMLSANLEKMQAAKNHPSIIIWSLGNESMWSPLWQKVQDKVKAFDPTRLTVFHDNSWGKAYNAGSKADIANFHYPDITGPDTTDTMKRPVLFGEYAHLSTYNRRELLTDPGIKSAYTAPLIQMYNEMYHHKNNLGGAIWAGIDDIFHMPDGRVVGYGPWGPIDGWRRPKPEYWGIKKAYAPVVILNVKDAKVKNDKLTLEVENRYDFISLKQITIICKVDGIDKSITSDIKAHAKGEIVIPVNTNCKEVYIAFKDPSGFIANEELIKLKKPAEPVYADNVLLSVSENDAVYFIQQGNIRYTINKITGVISSADEHGHILLSQGPVFSLVPANSDDGGKPNVAGETYQNNIYPIKNYPLYTLYVKELKLQHVDKAITVTMQTTYKTATGNIKYAFLKNGNVKVDYEVKNSGPDVDNPYQYGMLFQLPTEFDQLKWKRNGDMTIYSPDDISRNEGQAKLNAQVISTEDPAIQPTRLWKDDANEMGSNDFRSTKQNITTAELINKDRHGITILSDGKQDSRSWLQDAHIQLLVADYSTNGSERFYKAPFKNEKMDIAGKTVKGSVLFRLH